MKGREFAELIARGVRPVIEFTKGIEVLDGPDAGMRAVVTGGGKSLGNSFRVVCDIESFREYNEGLAQADWLDENDNPALTWFQTNFYNGTFVFYIDGDEEITEFTLVKNEFFGEYLQSGSVKTYVSWLEDELAKARGESAG